MEDIKKTIEEYRKGDLEKRLNLFLSHRSLRKEFGNIDVREAMASQQNDLFCLKEAA